MREVYIYILLDILDKGRYVGKSVNPKHRFMAHRKRKGWPVRYEILEVCTEDNWPEREKYWISCYDKLENKNKGGGGLLIRSEEDKRKISLSLMGHPTSKETRQKISNSLTGKTLSPETRAKISRKLTGVPNTNFLGRHFTEEMKEKLRATRRKRKEERGNSR